MPMRLPIPALTAKFARSDVAAPTGQGQLAFDIWLQSEPWQDHGFTNSSITHEIMIPLYNWGNYGVYPNGRNPAWYDHDAVINGGLYHVYCTKGPDDVLRYDFGGLNGHYGRYGWKMIVFQPDAPTPPGELDLAAFVNNGTVTWSAVFPATGSNWGIKTLSGVSLAAGTHTVAIIKDWGWIDVDSIEIAPASSP